MEFPVELRNPRKGLINIKNKGQICFLWCHVRHLNPSKEHPERLKKADQEIAKKLAYDGIELPVQEKDFNTIEVKNRLVFPIYISDQKFEDSIDLLLLIDDDKSHYVYMKDFDRFMFHEAKNKNKKWFCESCLQCFSSKSVLIKHKENCLSINGKQSVKLEKGIIEFKDYFKQIPVSFNIHADFECNLRGLECYEGSYTKKYQDHFPCSFAYKAVCVDDKFTKFFLEVKMQLLTLLKQFLRSINIAKK